MKIGWILLSLGWASFGFAEELSPLEAEISERKERMEAIEARFAPRQWTAENPEPTDAQRRELVAEVLAEMDKVDHRGLEEPAVREVFDFWYPPSSALNHIVRYAEGKPTEEAWAILTEMYEQCDVGLGAAFVELAPALIRVKLRTLFKEEEALATLPPLKVSKVDLPESIQRLPEKLQRCWRLAAEIQATPLDALVGGNNNHGELSYHRDGELFYTLIAHSIMRSQWGDAPAIASCDWGHFCGVGSEDFFAERTAYTFLAAILNDPVKASELKTPLLIRTYLEAIGFEDALVLSLAARNPFGTSQGDGDSEKELLSWRQMARFQLEEDVEDWEDAFAGLVLFDKTGLGSKVATEFRSTASPRVMELICEAVDHQEEIGEALNQNAVDETLCAETDDQTLNKRIATAIGQRVGQVEDAHRLDRLVDRLVSIKGEESNEALEKVARLRGLKAGRVALGELDLRGIHPDGIPLDSADPPTVDLQLILNGHALSGWSINQVQSFAMQNGGVSQSYELPPVRTGAEGRLSLPRQEFTLFDDEKASFAFFPDHGTKRSYDTNWKGTSPDAAIFSVKRTASELKKEPRIEVQTHRVTFDIEIPPERIEIAKASPIRMNLFQGEGYVRVEFPPGAPVVLDSVGPGALEVGIDIVGCSEIYLHNLKVENEPVTFGPYQTKPMHRVTWKSFSDGKIALFRKGERDDDWRECFLGSYGRGKNEVAPGDYRIEQSEVETSGVRRIVHQQEFTIREGDPYLVDLGALDSQLEEETKVVAP